MYFCPVGHRAQLTIGLGKNKEDDACIEKASLFTDVYLHSVMIDCVLEVRSNTKTTCWKRQIESEGYCNDYRNREADFPELPECGLYL